MTEALSVVSGFNIVGLHPIEVAKPVTGATITLTDSDIGYMNLVSGSANTTVVLPSAGGTLEGYSKMGRSIGFRGAHDMGAIVTFTLPAGSGFAGSAPAAPPTSISIGANHTLVLYSDGGGSPATPRWVIKDHRWPPQTGYVYAYRSADVGLSAGVNNVVCDMVAEGNADGWYNTSTGVYSPTLPGLYDFKMAGMATNGGTANVYLAYIGKNGTGLKCSGRVLAAASASWGTDAAAMLQANGISDSFRPMFQATAAGATLKGTITETWFEARYIGPA